MLKFLKEKFHIHVIILGAGFSKRYSNAENKLLLQIEGKPMYRHIVDKIIDIYRQYKVIDSIVYVTQYYKIALDLQKDRDCVNVIYNLHPERGISSSMQVGIAYSIKLEKGRMSDNAIYDIKFNTDNLHAYMFIVSDQPYIKKNSILRFIKCFINSNKGIGIVKSNKHSGNPVIFMDKYIPDLMRLQGDIGGKKIVNINYNDVFEYEVSEIENKDIDIKL